MNKDEFFNQVQDYIKQNTELLDKLNISNITENEIDDNIKISDENIDAVLTQNFGDVEECAKIIVEIMCNGKDTSDVKGGIDVTEAPVLDGDRALNTMERKVLSYKDFINEKKSDRHCKKCNIIIVQGVNSSNDSDFCSNCKF